MPKKRATFTEPALAYSVKVPASLYRKVRQVEVDYGLTPAEALRKCIEKGADVLTDEYTHRIIAERMRMEHPEVGESGK